MTFKKTSNISSNTYTEVDITDDLLTSIVANIKDIFVELGPTIVKNAGKASFSIKDDGTPVTEFDSQIENKIINRLKEMFPRLIVFGEETGYSEDLPEVSVLIDPIDGTKNFIKGTSGFTSMAVIIVNNVALACVINNPSSQKIYSAIKSKGSFVNDKKLDLTMVQLPKTAIYKNKHTKILSEILKPKNILRETASSGAGDGFSKVAEGLVAARFQINAGGHIHDYAPGALLVKEAGGKIISLNVTEYTVLSRNFIACHPSLENVLMNSLDELKNYSNSVTE